MGGGDDGPSGLNTLVNGGCIWIGWYLRRGRFGGLVGWMVNSGRAGLGNVQFLYWLLP